MENVIISSNTHGITPAVLSGARGDGIFAQFISNRIGEINTEENAVYLHNINIVPNLEEVSLLLDNGNGKEILKVIYTKNPAKNRSNTFATAYIASLDREGKVIEWEEIEKDEIREKLNLKGIAEENYRIGDIYFLMISMISTILEREERNEGLIKYFTNIYEMCEVKEDEVIFPIPSINNIEIISQSMQGMWNNISDETKKAIINNLSDNANFDEIEKIIKSLEDNKFSLKEENISYIDENSLFKLSNEYINTTNNNKIIQADKEMAKRILEKNPQIKEVSRKILNYYINGITPSGDVLVIKNEAVRIKSFYDDADTIKDKKEQYFAEMFNDNEKFLKSISKQNKNAFLKVLGAWDVLLEKGQKFVPRVETEEELTPEEYKKIIEEIKNEMAKDKGLLYEFKNLLSETKKFIETLEKSNDYISQSNLFVAKNVLNDLEEKIKKEVDIIESFEEFKKLQKNISIALNAYKETIYSFVINKNENLLPTNDFQRFPKTVSNSAILNYKELNQLQKGNNENYKRSVILGFAIKEVGKNEPDVVPILIPIAMYDNNNNVAKFNFSVSNLTKLTNLINQVKKLAIQKKDAKVDDIYKMQLKKLKDNLLSVIEAINKQKGSKIVEDKTLSTIKNEIQKAITFEELIKVIKNNITNKELPNVSLTIGALRFSSDQVKNALEGKEFNENLFFLEAFANFLVKKAIQNEKPLNEEKIEDSIVSYQNFFINKSLNGNRLIYKKTKQYTFLPVPSFGNPDIEGIKNIIKESTNEIKINEKEEQELKEKYGVKSKNAKLKSMFEKMKTIIGENKENMINDLKNKKPAVESVDSVEVENEMVEENINPKEIIESYEEEESLMSEYEDNIDIENLEKDIFSFDADKEEDIFTNAEIVDETLFKEEDLDLEQINKPKLKM